MFDSLSRRFHLKSLKKSALFLVFALCSISLTFGQFDIPEKPPLKDGGQTSVYDYSDLLSPNEKSTLETKLIKYSDSTSTQIVVAIIASTEGEYINYLGANWAQEWGIGDAKKDNGIFILLARDDRKIGISTGKGTEHLMTDAMSRRIIEIDIIPFFKRNDYYGGLNRGADAIFEVMQGEYTGTRETASKEGFPVGLMFFLFIVFIVIIASISKNKRGGGGGNHSNRPSILDAIILSSAGRGAFGGGGFGGSSGGGLGGGGGFGGGFGGGGFGGGGASGGW
ncbi:TPM domain-containing protein [Bizionia saleffrena]|uniref:TPM domain-containing protein n=1 Tax=Bizionia saleffrena TaxID=291189 RepID=A0A8H2QDZ3_9FLAO|nr:TPM domain-containing protein [Bizionia saleffrena]